ncbi:MAG: calcium-binding protein, partial [bacterium]
VSLLRNAIDDNALLGIDLLANGLVNPNDPGDTDTGLQNFPAVTLARTSEQDVRLQGTFESTANRPFRFELFASPLADPSGNGEGARFVAAFNGSTDALGQLAIDTLLTGVVNLGESVSMTATSLNFNNPSEFSEAFTSTDAYGIIVSPTAGLVTSEPGDSASFTVVLEYRPSSPVTIGLVSLDPTEGQPAVPSITVTSTNWNIPQTVWVKGVNDFVMDGDQAWTLELQPAVSADPKYNGRDADDVAVSNTDEDVAGITVAPTGGLATTEAGGSDVFTVQLDTEPVADVVITLATDTATEGVPDVDSVTLSASNWNVPQTVRVSGVNDFVVDGDTPFSIVLAAATSTDPNSDTLDPADVFVTTADDDVAGVAFDPALGLTTDENGGTSTVNVRLTAMPAAAVSFSLASSDTTEGTVSPSSLTFTAANWNVDQVVTLTGANDVIVDGIQSWTVVTGALVSSDPIFDTVAVDDLTVDNADNDVADATATPSAGLVTIEDGTPATFTVVLTSMPSAPVTFPGSSDDTTEGTVSPASLTVTGANWTVPQTVTVTGANDDVDDGDIAFNVVLGAMSSADVNFDGVDPADVSASNTDDDQAGITVAFGAGPPTVDPAPADSFTVVLDSEPTADVTFSLASDDATEGVAAVASLTFTAADWNVPQTVRVTGADDFVMDADQSYTVVLNAASSLDPNYDTLDPTDVPVLNQDDDVAGFTVSAPSVPATTEAGGTVTFTVVLTSEPVADVTVPVSSSDLTEGTVSPASLTFTAVNWNVAQTVTLTGVDDAVDDGDIAYDATLGAATSTDPNYAGLDATDVTIGNTDDDQAGIT